MQSMSTLDSLFLHAENEVSHMHLGAVALFDGPAPRASSPVSSRAGSRCWRDTASACGWCRGVWAGHCGWRILIFGWGTTCVTRRCRAPAARRNCTNSSDVSWPSRLTSAARCGRCGCSRAPMQTAGD